MFCKQISLMPCNVLGGVFGLAIRNQKTKDWWHCGPVRTIVLLAMYARLGQQGLAGSPEWCRWRVSLSMRHRAAYGFVSPVPLEPGDAPHGAHTFARAALEEISDWFHPTVCKAKGATFLYHIPNSL